MKKGRRGVGCFKQGFTSSPDWPTTQKPPAWVLGFTSSTAQPFPPPVPVPDWTAISLKNNNNNHNKKELKG